VGGAGATVDYAVVDIAIVDIPGALNSFKRTMVYDITQNEWCEWSSLDATTSTPVLVLRHLLSLRPHVSNSQDFSNTLIMEKTTVIFTKCPGSAWRFVFAYVQDGTRSVTVECVFIC